MIKTINIGELVLDDNIYYAITNTLTNCTNGNTATQIAEGEGYYATIIVDTGYELQSIMVTMGGIDITSSVVNGNSISISAITGDIVIVAVTSKISSEIGYTNMIPLSIDTDGNIYNEIGYKINTRLKTSTGVEETYNNVSVTGFISVNNGDIIYIKGFAIESSGLSKIQLYNAAKENITFVATTSFIDEGDGVYSYTLETENVAFIRGATYSIMDGSEILAINELII